MTLVSEYCYAVYFVDSVFVFTAIIVFDFEMFVTETVSVIHEHTTLHNHLDKLHGHRYQMEEANCYLYLNQEIIIAKDHGQKHELEYSWDGLHIVKLNICSYPSGCLNFKTELIAVASSQRKEQRIKAKYDC